MALDANELGQALKQNADQWNDKDIANIDQARADFWKGAAQAIIEHFENNGVVNVTVVTTGTATSQSGTGTGKIS